MSSPLLHLPPSRPRPARKRSPLAKIDTWSGHAFFLSDHHRTVVVCSFVRHHWLHGYYCCYNKAPARNGHTIGNNKIGHCQDASLTQIQYRVNGFNTLVVETKTALFFSAAVAAFTSFPSTSLPSRHVTTSVVTSLMGFLLLSRKTHTSRRYYYHKHHAG